MVKCFMCIWALAADVRDVIYIIGGRYDKTHEAWTFNTKTHLALTEVYTYTRSVDRRYAYTRGVRKVREVYARYIAYTSAIT